MDKSKLSSEAPRSGKTKTSENNQRDKRTRREIVEANLKALKHTRMAFQR